MRNASEATKRCPIGPLEVLQRCVTGASEVPGAMRGASKNPSWCFGNEWETEVRSKTQCPGNVSVAPGARKGASEVPHEPGGAVSRASEVP